MGALVTFTMLLLCIYVVCITDVISSNLDTADSLINKSDEIVKEIEAVIADKEKRSDKEADSKPLTPQPPPPPPPSPDAAADSKSKAVNEVDSEYDKDLEIAEILSKQKDIQVDEDEGMPPEDISTRIMDVNSNVDEDVSLFGGDMILTPRQAYEQATGEKVQGDLINDNSKYWNDKRQDPSGKWSHIIVIPYAYSGSINTKYISAMHGAVTEYNTKTCIRFVPESRLSRAPANAIKMMVGGGCYSSVGRTGRRYQDVSLGNRCEYKGIAIHELMHAIGYFHEQSRPDRDSYVRIMKANINPRMLYNFNKAKTVTQGTAYDYNSVMHYGETAFSINGRKTIIRLRGTGQLGQRQGLSTLDAISINKIYCNGGGGGGGGGGKPDPCGLTTVAAVCNKVKSGGLCTKCTLQKACPAQCGVKVDKNTNCARWARTGYCRRFYITWMRANCAKSCSVGYIAPACT